MMLGNITFIILDLVVFMALVAYFANRGLGNMSQSLRQLAIFLLDKAPVGLVDLFDKGEGKGARNWMMLGGLWFCIAATFGFLQTWLRYDPTALDSLASVGWSYNAEALAQVTDMVLVWGGFGMVLIGAGLVIQSRAAGAALASEANATLVAFAWSGLILVNILISIFIEVGRFEQTLFNLIFAALAGAVLLNHLLTLGDRAEGQPIEIPSWMLILGHTALVWGLLANAFGYFTSNTQLEWISSTVISGWFPLSLVLAVMTYSVAKASGAPIWSRNLSMAMLLLFASITPFAVSASSSASGLWVTIGAVGITIGLFPLLAASTNTITTLKGRWDCLVEEPAAACSAAVALLLPIFAIGAYFTALDTFAGIGSLGEVHTTVNQGFYWVIGGLLVVAALTQILPLTVGRELSSRSKARWAFWLVMLGGLGWTITSLMGDFAQMALNDAGAEGSVAGFRLTASVFLYGSVMGIFIAMHNATETVFSGTPSDDVDAFAGGGAPAGFRLVAGTTTIRQLLGQGLGIDSEIIVGGEDPVATTAVAAPSGDEFAPELIKFAAYLAESGKDVFEVFNEMDTNQDQVIDSAEFRIGMSEMGIAELSHEEAEVLLNSFDISGDGNIDLPELDILLMRIHNATAGSDAGGDGAAGTQEATPVSTVAQISAPADEEFAPELVKFAAYLAESDKTIFEIFSEMDLNKDLVIDAFEFREGLSAMEIADLAPWDVDSLMQSVDLSGDGKIDLPELDILIMRINNAAASADDDADDDADAGTDEEE